MGDLQAHFSEVTDKRKKYGKRHNLIDIIIVAICGILCGADDWVMIEAFGKTREKWFQNFLALPHGIPSHDTFGKVFAWIDPDEFQQCFMAWIKEIAKLTEGEVIAIDGKTVRRSHDRSNGKKAIHLVNAWACKNELVLGQKKIENKSNEITAIPELLKMLEISGCIITIDAMGTQKSIAQEILMQKADYILAVKQNQGKLFDRIQYCYEIDREIEFKDVPYDYAHSITKNHGRIEKRKCWVVSDREYLSYIDPDEEWEGLGSIAIVEGIRKMNGKTSSQLRYFISSLAVDAKQMLKNIRSHWAVENKLHWSLDVTFREDDSRVRKGYAPENIALVRKLALNLLRQNKSRKGGAKTKRLICAADPDFLLEILNSG